MTTITLSRAERSMMRATLLNTFGIQTKGMTADEMKAKYTEMTATDAPSAPTAPPVNDPQATPAPRKRKRSNPITDQPEDKPEATEAQPAPKSNGHDVKAKAALDALQALLGGQTAIVDEKQIIALIAKHSQAPKVMTHDYTITRVDGIETQIDSAHPLLGECLDVATCGENVYLVGPAGSGKTSLAIQMAEALEAEFYFTGSVAEKHELLGFVDAGGNYHETAFYKACKRHESKSGKTLFLFDELDGSIPSASITFNAAIENGYAEFANGEKIIIDRELTFFVGAGNTIGKGPDRQYVGRFPMDAAFLDRWEQIDIEYDLGIELKMAGAAWLSAGGNPDQIDVAQSWAHEVVQFRRLLDDRKILALISPRATRRGAKWLAKGWTIERVRKGMYKHLNDDQLASLGVSR